MKIHVLTLSWNGLDKLQKLRPGLCKNLENIPKIDYEWYIRDNGSSDNTSNTVRDWNLLDDYSVKTTVYSINHNRDSFSQGVNYLLEKSNPADEDYILLLNNDIVFNDEQSLFKMFNIIQKPDVGVVGARLLYTNTNKLQHAGVIFSERYNKMPYHFRPGEVSDDHSKKNRIFQAVTAAACFVKASELKKINGLDTGFRWAFEDIDMTLQIGKNKKIIYCGETNIDHEESASLKKNPVNKLFVGPNVAHFQKKWSGKYQIDHELYLKDAFYNEYKD
jgi:GT2 family glycosyltransferase